MASKVILWLAIIVLLLPACRSTNEVVSDAWLQKRKYTKGFHLRQLKHQLSESKASETPIFSKENKSARTDALFNQHQQLKNAGSESALKTETLSQALASEKALSALPVSNKKLRNEAHFKELFALTKRIPNEPEFLIPDPEEKSFFMLEVSGGFALAAILLFYIGNIVFLGFLPQNLIALGLGLLGISLVFYVLSFIYAVVALRQSFAEVKNGAWTKRKEEALFMVLALLFYPLLILLIFALIQFFGLP